MPDSQITFENNLTYCPNRASGTINWDGVEYTLSAFQLAKPAKGINCISADPLYVNTGTFDYSLQSGSPAKTAGVALSGFTVDFGGATRASPPSMGCYS